MAASYVVAVDVGTGSVRAAVISSSGALVGGSVEAAILTNNPRTDHYEQSSEEIWRKCGEAVREVLKRTQLRSEDIKGIAFDATCSLYSSLPSVCTDYYCTIVLLPRYLLLGCVTVVLGEKFEPVTVSTSDANALNIIVWMDHRAAAEAAHINATQHPLLAYVGGAMSLEMQPPKLLWLKKHLPASWARARHFLDLADFLTFRACGSLVRSACTVTCKWAYDAPSGKWDPTFFSAVGLEDLCEKDFARIGNEVRPVGDRLDCLTKEAAAHFGLTAATIVSTGVIDAHAGGLGVLGSPSGDKIEQRIAIISGTSTCLMACSRSPISIRGVWGPYLSAMIPSLWLSEGGESATGALLDHLISMHPAGHALRFSTGSLSAAYERLNTHIARLASAVHHAALLTKELHVLPYFHGNRAPRADPSLKGVISGLSLDTSEDSLALLYLAGVQALAHGTKHIIDSMNAAGYKISTLYVTGGMSKNALFLSVLADVCNAEVLLPRESEAVLLGTGIAAAAASGVHATLAAAQSAMCATGRVVKPSADPVVRNYYAAKHAVFLEMHTHYLRIRELMNNP